MPNEFNKNNHKDFPSDLFSQLTQLRKGNGMKIIYSTQDIMLIDPDIRRLTKLVHECKTYKRRLTYYFTYLMDYYQQKRNTINVDNKIKVHKSNFKYFIQTNKLRNSYDSFLFLDSAKRPSGRDATKRSGVTSDLAEHGRSAPFRHR